MSTLLICYIVSVVIALATSLYLTWHDWNKGFDVDVHTFILMIVIPFIPIFNLWLLWFVLSDVTLFKDRQ